MIFTRSAMLAGMRVCIASAIRDSAHILAYLSCMDAALRSSIRYAYRRKGGDHVNTMTAIKNRILQLCAERNITINKLATICALPPSSVKNILYGRSTDPKILTIKKLCDGLDITLGEFFSTPDFDALEQEIQ